MKNKIKTPKMSEFLKLEFMEPLGISAYKLAKDIGVPVSRVQDLLHDRRNVTVDTSLRLAKYFGVSDEFFLSIQNDIDFRNEREAKKSELERIKPIAIASGI